VTTRALCRLVLVSTLLWNLATIGHSAMAEPAPITPSSSNPPAVNAPESSTDSDPIQACVAAHAVSRDALQQQTLLQVRNELRQCAAEGCPIAIRSECAEWLTLAERQVPTLVFSATTGRGDVDSAKVFVDGQLVTERLDGRPLEAQLGPHAVVFELPDGRRQELRIVVGIGEKDRIVRAEFLPPPAPPLPTPPPPTSSKTTAALPPPAPSGGQRDLGVVLGLLSIGGAIAAGSLLYAGIKARDETSMRCTPNCTDAEIRSVRRWFILADIAGTTSAVSGGVGVYLFVTSDNGRKSPTAALQWQREF
jgi:hypothetical protein